MENFTILEHLCETQFSSVLRAKNNLSREIVVLKVIRARSAEEAPSKEVLREVLLLMNFAHPNIVRFHSVFVDRCSVVVEMEFCISSLSSVLKQISKPFYTGQIKKIVKSIAKGIKFLHDHDIIHRDIKPGNIFIDENCNVKIGDFGSSRIYVDKLSLSNTKDNTDKPLKPITKYSSLLVPQRPLTAGVGTKWYKAPELILGKKEYDKAVDVWSFGCLVAELVLLEPLFPGNTDFEMVGLIFNFLGFSPEDELSLHPSLSISKRPQEKGVFERTFDQAEEGLVDLMRGMIVADPGKRMSIGEVLEHPFLREEESFMECNLPI